MTSPELGTIEGYYGPPWSWAERTGTMRFLAERGYAFHLYAPKTDPWLRERWREARPEEEGRALRAFGEACADAGVRFGVGLSPMGLAEAWDDAGREALTRKLAALDALGVAEVALLFDDMDGSADGLAARQVEIAAFARERTGAARLSFCPTYYSDDPTLDRVFGARPDGYLEELGRGLHPEVRVFWTGPEVVSRAIPAGHVDRVAGALGRAPFLWDNYPVNDGRRMSAFLHLRGFTGRGAELAGRIAGHGVNPALQPVLTRIPMATLPDVYRLGGAYDYAGSFREAAEAVLGAELGARLHEDLIFLQDWGRARLEADAEARLRARWEGADHPGAREVVAWLDGAYEVEGPVVPT